MTLYSSLRIRGWLIATPLALMVACSNEPQVHDQVEDVLAGYQYQAPGTDAPTTEPNSGPWWQEMASSELDRTIQAVLTSNYDLHEAAARVRSATAVAEAVAGRSNPQLGAAFDNSRSRSVLIGIPIPGAPNPLATTSTSHQLGLDLSWEVDLWGRLDADERAAVADMETALSNLEGAQLSLSGLTAKAWLALLEAREQEEFVEAQLENARGLLAHLERAYQQGGSSAPLRDAEARVSAWEASRSNAKQQSAVRERQLVLLLGTASKQRADYLPSMGTKMPELDASVPVGLPATLLERRPDLQAAEASLRAADARLQSAQRALYPSLRLTASGGTRSDALGDLLDGNFSVWNLAAGLSAPLFQGGTLRANIEAQEAASDAAAWSFARAVLSALIEVENALVQEQAMLEQKAQLAQQAESERLRLQQAERQYRSGVCPAVDIFAARATWLGTQSQERSLQLMLLHNRIDLHLALGGSFAPSGS